MSKDYTVTVVNPSRVIGNEALLWLGNAETPYARSIVWDRQRQGEFPKVGATVTLP